MHLRRTLHRLGEPFLDFLFPPVCRVCDRLLPDGSVQVCDECWNSVKLVRREDALFIDTRSRLLDRLHIVDLVSVFVFEREGVMQNVIHALKYEGTRSLGRELGVRLGKRMQKWRVAGDVLIPVPLHRAKERERGYNQSTEIAKGISLETFLPVLTKAVLRTRNTPTQTRLTIEQRVGNVRGAFEIRQGDAAGVAGHRCVLVDDVITTGATLNECASVLMMAGARSVIAASAALADKDSAMV